MELIKEETEQKSIKKSSKTTKSKSNKVKPEDEIEKVVEEKLLELKLEEQKLEELKLEEVKLNEVKLNEVKTHDNTEDVENESNGTEENQISSVSESDYINKYNNIIEDLNFIKKNDIKDFELTKDLINDINKKISNIDKLFMNVRHNFTDYTTKESSSSLKNKSKKNKVKNTNNANAPINKKKPTYPEVLKFLKFDEEVEVSRAEILIGINAFVKEQKTNKNPDIFIEGDNSKFVLIGDLKIFFNFIKKQMIERGDLKKEDENTFPDYLGYRDIMKYTKYCFPESQK